MSENPTTSKFDDILSKLNKVGSDTNKFTWGKTVYTFRTLSVEDEIYVLNQSESVGSQESKLWIFRLYYAALSITEVDGVNVYESLFGSPDIRLTSEHRDQICKVLVPMFSSWGGRVFRWFFKYIWAWSDTRGMDIIGTIEVEEFLSPSELRKYADLKLIEELEGDAGQVDFTDHPLLDSLNDLSDSEDSTKT